MMARTIEISPGTFLMTTKVAITPSKTKYTGKGTTPILNSMSFHQPSGQKRVEGLCGRLVTSGVASARVSVCIGLWFLKLLQVIQSHNSIVNL
jgi:hypothetical protein